MSRQWSERRFFPSNPRNKKQKEIKRSSNNISSRGFIEIMSESSYIEDEDIGQGADLIHQI